MQMRAQPQSLAGPACPSTNLVSNSCQCKIGCQISPICRSRQHFLNKSFANALMLDGIAPKCAELTS